jgi:hypothetical protein
LFVLNLCRGSTEQSHGRSSLQSTVTDTIKASTLPKATEEDAKSPYIAAVSPSSIYPNQYRLLRLSKAAGEDISEILYTKVRTMNELCNIEELSDGSWELLVLNAHCDRLEVTFGQILPGWNVDLVYDPEDPTIDDLKNWNYAMAKQLRQSWFRERAGRVVKRKLYPAAAYYNYRLARSLNISIFHKDDIELSDDSLGSGFPSMKDRIVKSTTRENDHCVLSVSNHDVTGSVKDLPLHPTSIVDDLGLQQVHPLSTHKSNGSLYGNFTDGCDLHYPIVDSPEGKDWYAARMEKPSYDAVMSCICYDKVLKILAEARPIVVVRVPSAIPVDTFMLARVFMAKQYNTGVEIGLAYRGRDMVHVCKMIMGTFEDFAHHGIYFTSKQDIMCEVPLGPRWTTEFRSLKLRSWLGIH